MEPKDCANGRTHEPSLRELTAELDGARDVFNEKIESLVKVTNERDRRYEDRFRAMDEKTSLALTSSEKAVTKAETATEKRFDSVNEFRNTLKDQASNFMPRPETEAKFKAYDDKFDDMKKDVIALRQEIMGEIGGLRESRSEAMGSFRAVHLVGALLSGLLGAGIAILALIFKK